MTHPDQPSVTGWWVEYQAAGALHEARGMEQEPAFHMKLALERLGYNVSLGFDEVVERET